MGGGSGTGAGKMERWTGGKRVKGIVSDPPPFHFSDIPSFSPGGGIGVDGPAEAEDFFFAVFGLEAGEDFGGGGTAEFEEPHGVGDEDGENFVFEVGGFGVGVELGTDDFGPVGSDLRDLGVGGEFHFLEDAGNEGKMENETAPDLPPFHSSNIPRFSPGGGIGVDGPAEAEDFFFAVFGLEAGEDFGGGGAAEFEEPHGVGDEYGEDFVFEVGGFGIGVKLGADELGPVGGDLGDLGVGGELHFLENAGNERAEGDGAGVGGGGSVGVDVEALAGDGPLAFVVGFSTIHGGIL